MPQDYAIYFDKQGGILPEARGEDTYGTPSGIGGGWFYNDHSIISFRVDVIVNDIINSAGNLRIYLFGLPISPKVTNRGFFKRTLKDISVTNADNSPFTPAFASYPNVALETDDQNLFLYICDGYYTNSNILQTSTITSANGGLHLIGQGEYVV